MTVSGWAMSLFQASQPASRMAWALGHDPSLRFLCVSYSEGLANEHTRQFRMAVDGASASARASVIDWYDGTLSTRLNDKEHGVIILVMQRLHQEDLAGYLIERGGWHQLSLPAIAVEDQAVPIGPGEVHRRKQDEVLHPDRESRATLDRIKTEIGSLQFSAQYQQNPVPPEGNLIKRDWLRACDAAPLPGRGIKVVQSWDIATTTDERNDWSVCTTWAVKRKDYHLLDVWRGRVYRIVAGG